ncbi:DUF58 domain-containing protein [Candidatus Poribacteria bacterium]|nr:DUF58 domain-containing protein [Candidatus Poribacteria bacterium]
MKKSIEKKPAFGRRNLTWFAGAAALLLFAYATGSGLVVYFLYATLLIMALSRLIVEICLRGLECLREVSRMEIPIGERVEVILTVRNKGFLPIPWAFVEDLLPQKMPITGEYTRLLTLMPGQEEKLLYQIVFNRRGYHQIGPVLTETGDIFGFFRRYKTGSAKDYVIVYPSVESITEYDIAARRPLGTVKITNRIFEDPARILGVREYAPGDPFNRIHWKTSARTGVLHTKVYEPSKVIGATIVLDFHEDGYRKTGSVPISRDRGELAVITAASLANYIAEANEQVGLITNGRDLAEEARWESLPLFGKFREQVAQSARRREKSTALAPFMIPTRKGSEQGRLILEALARLDYTDGSSIDRILSYVIQQLSRDSSILVIVPEVSDATAVTLSVMKEAGFSIYLFMIDNEAGYFEAVDKLVSKSIDIYHIKDVEGLAKFATQDIYY